MNATHFRTAAFPNNLYHCLVILGNNQLDFGSQGSSCKEIFDMVESRWHNSLNF